MPCTSALGPQFGAHDHFIHSAGDPFGRAMLAEVGAGPGVVWIVRAKSNRDPEPDLL
jgi:hypothetical protein